MVEKGEKNYCFDCLRLASYSNDIKDYEIEYIFADLKDTYLIVISTVANRQAGIIAVVDIINDTVVHIQNGEFAVAATIVDKKVVSFHNVVLYGQAPYYTIDVSDFGNMDIGKEIKSVKVPYESDFYTGNNLITISVKDKTLEITNGSITHLEDIGGLL